MFTSIAISYDVPGQQQYTNNDIINLLCLIELHPHGGQSIGLTHKGSRNSPMLFAWSEQIYSSGLGYKPLFPHLGNTAGLVLCIKSMLSPTPNETYSAI